MSLVLIKDISEEIRDKFNESTERIIPYIKQNKTIWEDSINNVYKEVENNLNIQMEVIETLHGKENGMYILVPDTNALLINPDIEKWKFENISKFEILIIPTVSSELDKLKINHRNQSVRNKSKKIIRKFSEYRRRGKLTKGVTIVKNKINLRAFAIEPDFSNTLSWLDARNNDDRIIASFIEIMRLNPYSKVVLLTNDFNLQNKAEFAKIPYITPQEMT